MAKGKKIKVARFARDVFDSGIRLYAADGEYPLDEQTMRWVRRGAAVEAEVMAAPALAPELELPSSQNMGAAPEVDANAAGERE